VALVLFSMGGVFALYEGIHKLSTPQTVDNPLIAFLILGLAVALESFSLRTAVHEARDVKKETQGWWNFIRTAKSPELPIVLLEDVGAEFGLLFAFFGLAMSEVTGNARWDAVGSAAIGLLLVSIAGILAVEMKGLLIGEAASDDVLSALQMSIAAAPRVNGLIHLRTMHLGPEELLVAAKIDFDHDLSVAGLADAIDTTEAAIRSAVPIATTIYLEPDIRRAASS
jgi:divalent metal cation (Fe/Co/Zn/Cd) transporter